MSNDRYAHIQGHSYHGNCEAAASEEIRKLR